MAKVALPREPDRFYFGQDDLNNSRMLQLHRHLLMENMFPGLTSKPRFGLNEKQSSGTSLAYGGAVEMFRPKACYYQAGGKEFVLVWHKSATTGEFGLEAWNVTDSTKEILFYGQHGQDNVYCSMTVLYGCVYVAFDYEMTTARENSYRTRNKILKYASGAWTIMENGIDVAPGIANLSVQEVLTSTLEGRRYHQVASFQSRVYIIGGETQTGKVLSIQRSQNGQTFSAVTITEYDQVYDESYNIVTDESGSPVYGDLSGALTARTGHAVVEHDSKLCIIGGEDGSGLLNDVWTSDDGETWVRHTNSADWTARKFHTALSYDGKLWVIGGEDAGGDDAEVWYSTDYVQWTQATASAAFGARSKHTALNYDSKMWVILGDATSVYYSTDGATWTQATADAGIGDLQYHSSVTYDSKMWIIAGDDDGTKQDDVYSSTDGITWTSVQATPDFSDICGSGLVVFNSAMWLYMGDDGTADYVGDIWYSSDGSTWTQASSGMTQDKYVDYAWTYVRREDSNSLLSAYSAYNYTPWETFEGSTLVGYDEKLLAGTVTLSGTSLTGSGTTFTDLTANSSYIRIDGTHECYKVTAISDDTNATVENDDSDSYTAKEFALMPRLSTSITTDTFHEGRLEGIEDSDERIAIQVQSSGSYGRVFIKGPDVTDAKAQGATHIRIYRTLESATQAGAEALSHRYLVDWAIDNQCYETGDYYRDDTTNATLTGETNYLLATGYNVPQQGRYIDFDTKLWIGGDPDNPGYWFYSEPDIPNVQYPEKYASWFKATQYWITCEPDDGQKDSGTMLLAGDRYFFKERKIFVLHNSDPDNKPEKISANIGCFFPYTLTRMHYPQFGGECIGFISHRGPAVLMQGGQVRLLYEFTIANLWRKRDAMILGPTGAEYSWTVRNLVDAAFFANTWVIGYGSGNASDSDEPWCNAGNENYVYGLKASDDGISVGPFRYRFAKYSSTNIVNPNVFAVDSVGKCYCFSCVNNAASAMRYRLMVLEDETKYVDYFASEGDCQYTAQVETGYMEVAPSDWTVQARVYEAIVKMVYNDTDAVGVVVTSDNGRLVGTQIYSQEAQSGVEENFADRDMIRLYIKEGLIGNRFKIRITKIVPTDGDFEVMGFELRGETFVPEPKYFDAMETITGDTTYVVSYSGGEDAYP